MVISITTSNLNGIRAAKRKDMYSWVEQHTPDVWAMQEVRAPQSEIDPIFSEISGIYAQSPKGASMSEPLACQNEICRIKGRAGVVPEERVYIDKWLDELEYVDVMRDLAGEIQGPYTWWSQRGKAFDNDTGWRIDYQFATPELAHTARGFRIDKAPSYDTRWSDHAALTITYEV